jgi:hypothetical protein
MRIKDALGGATTDLPVKGSAPLAELLLLPPLQVLLVCDLRQATNERCARDSQ